ncbi:MAG: ATP synthase subunit I [Oscillospiraceae bacterium]|jgi:hypothetical protein
MKISPGIKAELKPMLIGMVILNAAVSAVTLIFGFNPPMLIGLAVGCAFMCGNMLYLGFTVSRAVEMTVGRSKKVVVINYLLRYSILGLIVFLAYQTKYINALGIFIPLFYPKPVYAFNRFVIRKEEKL